MRSHPVLAALVPWLAPLLVACSPEATNCPPERPPEWTACAENPLLPSCAFIEASLSELAPSEPESTCSGFPLDAAPHDPCVDWPGMLVGGGFFGEGLFGRAFAPNHRFGVRFELVADIDPATGLGRARFCRVRFTDVRSAACAPSDWTCASEGTIVLDRWSADGSISVADVHGEIHVSFPEGETVDAVF